MISEATVLQGLHHHENGAINLLDITVMVGRVKGRNVNIQKILAEAIYIEETPGN